MQFVREELVLVSDALNESLQSVAQVTWHFGIYRVLDFTLGPLQNKKMNHQEVGTRTSPAHKTKELLLELEWWAQSTNQVTWGHMISTADVTNKLGEGAWDIRIGQIILSSGAEMLDRIKYISEVPLFM